MQPPDAYPGAVFLLWFKKGSGTFVRSILRALPAKLPDPFLNLTLEPTAMPPMTLTEKILARHAGRDHVQPGDNIWVDVDILMTHDVCGPGTIGVFKQHFGKDAKVWDRDKVVIIPDHYIFTADAMANRNVDVLRQFAAEQKLPYFYDVGTPTATRASATSPCPKKGTPGPARCCSAPTATPARPGRSASSPPASATPTPASSWAPASSGSRCRRRCVSSSTASCRPI